MNQNQREQSIFSTFWGLGTALLSAISVIGMINAQESQELPQDQGLIEINKNLEEEVVLRPWSEEDYSRLLKGELIPGEDFFGPNAFSGQAKHLMPQISEEMLREDLFDQEQSGEPFSEAQVEGYFSRRPARYLVDPQGLLSEQVYNSHVGFLNYHAGDSQIDFYVYLFDSLESLPDGYGVQEVFDRHFLHSGDAVLVFYELGRPQKARWAVSESIKKKISPAELSIALSESVDAAFRKSDPADQLDNFSIQISNHLHWIENTMKGQGGEQKTIGKHPVERSPDLLQGTQVQNVSETSVKGVSAGDQKGRLFSKEQIQGVICGGSALITLGGVFLWLHRVRSRRQYQFALESSADTLQVLDARHGGGGGAMISFSSSRIPTSVQREQVSEYLTTEEDVEA